MRLRSRVGWVRSCSSGFPVCRWGLMRSSSSSVCTLCVVLIQLVRAEAPWRSPGSFGFVWFILVRPWGRWVPSSSFGCALTVDGFFRVHLVQAGGPWMSLGTIGFVCFVRLRRGVTGFFRVRLVCQVVPWVSLGSFGFVWFVRVRTWGRWSSSGWGVVVFLCVCLVQTSATRVHLDHSGALWWSLGSFVVNWGSFGSFRRVLGVVGFIWARSGGRWVHSHSFGHVQGHSGVPWELLDSFGFVWFIQACSWGRWVHLSSFVSFGHAFGVVEFLRVRLLHSAAPKVSVGAFVFVWYMPWGQLGSFGFVQFI